MSVFAKYQQQNYPYRFHGELRILNLAGGVPTDPNIARGWLKSKLAASDDLIRAAVAEVMVGRGVDIDAAVDVVAVDKHLCGFKRDALGLYIEGRQLKACLKEAASVAANEGRLLASGWGTPRNVKTSGKESEPANFKKGLKAWFPEHVFVVEDLLHLGVEQPAGVIQRFVHTHKGSAINYEEYVEDVKVSFTVETDHAFTDDQWAAVWLTAERLGIGASRSQGFGRFEVTAWDRVDVCA